MANGKTQFKVAGSGNILQLPMIADITAATWTAFMIGFAVPPTASQIKLVGCTTGTSNQGIGVAPNGSYSIPSNYESYANHIAGTANPAPMSCHTGANGAVNLTCEMALESSNIYGVVTNAGTDAFLYCIGFTDNL
jgi:hypothetical protein